MKAWAEAYVEYGAELRGYLRRRTRDEDAAEDLVQETFRRVLSANSPLREPKARRSYLFQTASRLLFNRSRRSYLEALDESSLGPDGFESQRCPSPNPGELAVAHDLENRTEAILEDLPVDQADCFRLSALQGFSHREIESQTGFSRAKIKICIFRARKRLIEELSSHEDPTPRREP